MSGLSSKARASSTRWNWPPDKSAICFFARSDTPAWVRAAATTPLDWRLGKFRKPRTVRGRVASICSFCGTYPMRKSGARFTLPLVGLSAPIRTRSKLDLPDPLGPTIVTISPASMAMLMSSNTV